MLDKKDAEKSCLDFATKAAKTQTGESRRILEMLNGEDYCRNDKERPDFVKLYCPKDKSKAPIMIGIEHFRADQLSTQLKNGRIGSTGVRVEKDSQKAFENRRQATKDGNFSEKSYIEQIGSIVARHIESLDKTSYNTFIESFRYSLGKHIGSLSDYRNNLNNYSKGNFDIKLSLMIEMHLDLRDLFFYDNKGVRRISEGAIPIFEDIVEELERKANPKLVDYIVLCIYDSVSLKPVKAVAFKSKNIRLQLRKQHIPIYYYVGDDVLFQPFSTIQNYSSFTISDIIEDESGYKVKYKQKKAEIPISAQLDFVFYSLFWSLILDNKKTPYCTSVTVQFQKEVFSDYITGWYYSKEDNGAIRPKINIFDKQFFVERAKCFYHKWYPNSTGDFDEQIDKLN